MRPLRVDQCIPRGDEMMALWGSFSAAWCFVIFRQYLGRPFGEAALLGTGGATVALGVGRDVCLVRGTSIWRVAAPEREVLCDPLASKVFSCTCGWEIRKLKS